MPFVPPKFWNQPHSCLNYLLRPLSWLYRGGAALHQKLSKPYYAGVPVISIGNFVLGGAGKTPLTIAVAEALKAMGRVPHIISRGYGGSLRGPIQVDLERHQFHQVGDEPLLLAKVAPTWVSKNRRDAVNLAIQSGADVLLLDDGHQNYTVKKDLCLVVVNASQGFGNGQVFPAGPLRQTIKVGLKQTSAVVYINENNEPLPTSLSSIHCPLILANTVPLDPKPCSVLAFAGIGYPEKFRQTLLLAGYEIKAFFSFPDHHAYTEEDLRLLRRKAQVENALLMTTEKDSLRIPVGFRETILTLPIGLNFHPTGALQALLKQFLKL